MWLQWHPSYSDTFLSSRGCHCKRGSLYKKLPISCLNRIIRLPWQRRRWRRRRRPRWPCPPPRSQSWQRPRATGYSFWSKAAVRILYIKYNIKPTETLYGVTNRVEPNLPLTSKQYFRFGLAWLGLARPKWNLCFKVNGRFCTTWCVTLYLIHSALSYVQCQILTSVAVCHNCYETFTSYVFKELHPRLPLPLSLPRNSLLLIFSAVERLSASFRAAFSWRQGCQLSQMC